MSISKHTHKNVSDFWLWQFNFLPCRQACGISAIGQIPVRRISDAVHTYVSKQVDLCCFGNTNMVQCLDVVALPEEAY